MNKNSLFKPFDLGGTMLRNRIVMAPLTRARAGAERIPNGLMSQYYSQRASAGLIITEATVISEQAIGWLNTPGIYNDAQQAGWKRVVDTVHEAGAPIFIQLWHTGRASHSSLQPDGRVPVAPSAVRIDGDHIHTPLGKVPYETPREMTIEEIEATIEDYRRAARRAYEAGFDGIEIHAANGYLIDTFLQSRTNKRTDRYGGSIENRFNFLLDVLTAVLTVWPANKVGVRLSPNGVYNDMGSPDYRETFTYVAGQLDKFELAYLHVLNGLGLGFHGLGEPVTLSELREVFDGTLMGNAGYDQASAEHDISEELADLIAFGRPFISNPDLVERFANAWPLNPPAEMKDWYSFEKEGYIDFPTYQESLQEHSQESLQDNHQEKLKPVGSES